MATIENYIRLRDGFSPVLDRISQASNTVANRLEKVAHAADNAGNSAEGAAGKFGALKTIFAGNLLASTAVRGVEAIKNGLDNLVQSADAYAGVQARLQLVAGSQENVAALNNMIYESAQRARGGYMDMARSVAQLSLSAHDAFPDPREATQFMEGIQKMFVIGGVDKEHQKDAMLQLTQGLGSGQLQGDEFRSIAENAPIIENMIAKEMGVPRGALKQLASEGKITADVIRDSILNNMDEINAQFATMPKRWGDHFTELTNVATRAFAPVFIRMRDLANSDGVRFFVDNIAWAISAVAPMFYAAVGAIQWFIDTAASGIAYVGGLIHQHAGLAEGVLTALGLALLYVGLTAAVTAGQMGAAALATGAKAVADGLETGALLLLTLAQDGFNVALAECPLTWIIGAIVVLIGIFYLAVAAVNHFAGTSISATGLIFGAFAWLGAGILNMIKLTANVFIALANFLGSVFNDPVGAIYNLFVDIWNAIVGYVAESINAIIAEINRIPGVNISTADAAKWSFTRKDIPGGTNFKPFTYTNQAEAEQAGYNLVANGIDTLTDGIKSFEDRAKFDQSKLPGAGGPASQYDPTAAKDTAGNTKRTADNTEKIANALEMTDEEIKELRDSAIQQVISQWQEQHLNVTVENHNNISSDVDIDGMTSNLVKGIQEALEIHREGVKA